MRLEIEGVGMTISSELEDRIRSKFEKYDRYFDDKALCTVKCTTDGPEQERVEITLHVDGRTYRAERSEDDIYTALDSAIDVFQGQIRKHKTIMKNMRTGGYKSLRDFIENELPEEDDDEVDEFNFRYKEFEIQPMSDEEATLQMNLLDHDFFVYLSDIDGRVRVVYKRKGDSYGVLAPIY